MLPEKAILYYSKYIELQEVSKVAEFFGVSNQNIYNIFKENNLVLIPEFEFIKRIRSFSSLPRHASAQQIISERKTGMAPWKICVKLGASYERVVSVLKEAGVFGKPYPTEQRNRTIARDYKDMSTAELSRKYNLSLPVIIRILEKMGVERRSNFRAGITLDDEKNMAKMYKTKPLREVANKYKISETTVMYHIKKYIKKFLVCTDVLCSDRKHQSLKELIKDLKTLK